MSKLHLSLLCLATAGLMLAGCGDNEKKVTGPAMDGVSEGATQTGGMFTSLAARKAAGVHPFWESAEGSGVAGKISTALATVGSGSTNILMLADVDNEGTSALANVLAGAGYTVSVRPAPEYTWDGTNPSLDGFDCVIHLDGVTYSSPLPVSGQQALEAFVQNGGGYITSQWTGYERGQQPAMGDLILQGWLSPESDNCGGCAMTWTTVPGQESHPVLAGIPSSFEFHADGHDAGPQVEFADNPSTVLMRSPAGGPAVLVRSLGNGRIVNFSVAANYFGDRTLQDLTIQKLYTNAVTWASGAPQHHEAPPAVWTASGPGVVTVISDGASADPKMTYNLSEYGTVFSTQTWEFTTTATQGGQVTLPYHYSGFHAFFQVQVFLQPIVGGVPVATLVNAGPVNCCSSPSNGFDYSGHFTFNVTAGQTYGFRFGGSNYDSDARLLGTFEVAELVSVDTTPPAITINGPTELTLECHVAGGYTDAGATATDDVDGAVAVTATGSVNTTVEGDYTITYTATDAAGNTATATRTVHVVDTTAPAITLNGAAALTLECHVDSYSELGATAVDACDGAVAVAVSGSVNTTAEGTYTITYTAVDASGNTATATSTVVVVDTTPPAITLNGAAALTLECHVGVYTEAGATASDLCDGVVEVVVSGIVDTTVEGEYVVTYTATDDAGNTSTATRTVNVVDTTAPSLALTLSKTSLWPPNHEMISVGSVSATDLCDPTVALAITVTSNEPENGTGDGDTGPDWEVVDNGDGTATVSVRAERKGNGTGRIYTISVAATDEAGNTTAKTGTVSVAHSQSKKK